MKLIAKFTFLIVLTLTAGLVFAQTNTFPASGNAGIGTLNPQHQLEIIGNYKLHTSGLGGIYSGIGIRTSNRAELHLHANGDNVSEIHFGENSRQDSNVRWTLSSRNSTQNSSFNIYEGPKLAGNWQVRFSIQPGGNVGVGTTSPTAKLAVNGDIKTKEIIVTEQGSDWPDYVFDTDYPLPDLFELERFIQGHRHLPGIPSGPDVEENGQNIGDIQVRLLKKIEELILINIRQQKEIESLFDRITKLEEERQI